MHFTRGAWATTFVPLGFALAPQENIPAAGALVDSVIESLQQVGIDLVARTSAIYLDGGAALVNVFQNRFPGAVHIRCLQHVKKDIVAAKKHWRHHDYSKDMKDYAHRSAPLEPHLFNAFWRRVFQDLENQGENDFVEYMRGNLVYEQDGLLWALWQCYPERVCPPIFVLQLQYH